MCKLFQASETSFSLQIGLGMVYLLHLGQAWTVQKLLACICDRYALTPPFYFSIGQLVRGSAKGKNWD